MQNDVSVPMRHHGGNKSKSPVEPAEDDSSKTISYKQKKRQLQDSMVRLWLVILGVQLHTLTLLVR